jgi:hypothetical protein
MQREEYSGHGVMRDIRDVHSSSIARKKGLSCQQQRIVQSAKGLTTTIAHLRGFASMIEDIQLGITVNSVINGSQFTIRWGAKPASTIDWGQGHYS